MIKVRLSRIGSRGQPYYRVVVVDERAKRDGAVKETIGRYNPRTEPSTFEIDKERLSYWRGVGAQLTEPVLVLLGEVEPKKHQPKNVKKEEAVAPAAPNPAPATKVAGEPLPEPTPAEGAASVETNAPEETPAASPELAKEAIASSEVSPEVSSDVIGETVENTEVTAANPAPEENQPTSGETPVDVAEESAETDNPEERATA